MEISEVRIKLVENSSERLRAFCSITLDGDFVIRDLKIIDGLSGPFVAMPSRKLADRCPRCGCKNHLRAKYCNDCGLKLNENRAPKDPMGRAKLHADVAHPINAGCRERIQTAVVQAYEAELERSKSPDYRPPVYDDFGDDDVTHLVEEEQRRQSAAKVVAAAPQPAPAADIAAAEEEPETVQKDAVEGEFSDYNSLIADLKREAATRHGRTEKGSAEERPHTPAAGRREPPARDERGRSDRGGRRNGRNDRGRDTAPQREPRAAEQRGPRQQDEESRPAPAAPPPSAPAAAKSAPQEEEDDFSAGL